jgi:hypothetical protein
VPEDLKLAGKSETFTITVTYDTLELYGKVEASRNITVTSELEASPEKPADDKKP